MVGDSRATFIFLMGISFFTIVLYVLLLCTLPVARTSAVSIHNEVETSADTGGNNASGGTVIEGTPEVEIHAHSEVNGKVIEDYNELFEAMPGQDINIDYQFEQKVLDEGGSIDTSGTRIVEPFVPEVVSEQEIFPQEEGEDLWMEVQILLASIFHNVFSLFSN